MGLASVIEAVRDAHMVSPIARPSAAGYVRWPIQLNGRLQYYIWLRVKSCEMSLALRQFHQTRDITTVMNFLGHRNQACYESTKEESELGGQCMSPLIDGRSKDDMPVEESPVDSIRDFHVTR